MLVTKNIAENYEIQYNNLAHREFNILCFEILRTTSFLVLFSTYIRPIILEFDKSYERCADGNKTTLQELICIYLICVSKCVYARACLRVCCNLQIRNKVIS